MMMISSRKEENADQDNQNKKNIRIKPAMAIYRPPGLRLNKQAENTLTDSSDEASENKNYCSEKTGIAKTQLPVNGGDHHVKFEDRRSAQDNREEQNATKPIKAAGSQKQPQPYKNRSHTSPLAGLVPNGNVDISTSHSATISSTNAAPARHYNGALMGGGFFPLQNNSQFPLMQLSFTGGTLPVLPPLQQQPYYGSTPFLWTNGPVMTGAMSSGNVTTSKWGPQQMVEARGLISNLKLNNAIEGMHLFIQSNFELGDLAYQFGNVLVLAPIEQGKPSKLVSRLCSMLFEAPSGADLYSGLMDSNQQYLECADSLRNDHFRYWLNFLGFLSDLLATAGFTFNGELLQLLFKAFDYMLKPPVLETLKIEELEAVISALMANGFQIERECPDELVRLRNMLRDAFINANEPWARKMILLLVELSASNWKLPPEANEYYFLTSQMTPSPSSLKGAKV